jgi:hypothetical protein
METTSFELIIRAILAVAVLFSLLYIVLRLILCSIWYSFETEIKKFTSYQYMFPIKHEVGFKTPKAKYIRFLNFLLKIQYILLIATIAGMMALILISALKF